MNVTFRVKPLLVLAALLLVAFATVAVGCSSASSPSASPTPSPTASPSPAPSPTPSSSYSARADGSVEATGYVAYEGLEGGFWTLQDIPVGPSSVVQPKVIAVLLPEPVTESQIAAMDGAFVRVTGRLSVTAWTHMAGREVLVATIAGASSDAPR